jgi:DNA-binding transcriptional regulator YdaS (Cro superfamily)
MLLSTALQYYKNKAAIARALGISRAAISQWGDVVPESSAYKLQVLNRGKLKVDSSLYAHSNGGLRANV